MAKSETLLNTKREYRDHYIRVRVVAQPPLPHDDEEDGTITAHVKLYDGPPGDMGLLDLTGSKFAADVVDSWSEEIPLIDSEDEIESLIESAKERIRTRRGQHYGIRESAAIALERSLEQDGDPDA